MSIDRTPTITASDFVTYAKSNYSSEVIEGIGGPGAVFEIFGDEGSGKTRLALRLAAALNREPAWGPFKVVRNGSVLLLEADMSEPEQAQILEEFQQAGFFTGQELVMAPNNAPRMLYRVDVDRSVSRVVRPLAVPEDLTAVLIDTWSSVFASSDATDYDEQTIRAVMAALRVDYPNALFIVLNHTTIGEHGHSRSLSPGLRRMATTRYRVQPGQRDPVGLWMTNGLMRADGKHARALIPRQVALAWPKGEPGPLPVAGAVVWTAAHAVAAFPNVTGLQGTFSSQRDALEALSACTKVPVGSLRSALQARPNPALQALQGKPGRPWPK